jgi:hypothetical protein
MKLKGINPIEQHIEKAVVGVTGLVFLGVIAQQFLTQPNQVKVGSDSLPPERAFEPVKRAADVLKGKMESGSPELHPDIEKSGADLKKQFDALVSGGIAPRKTIGAVGPSIALGGGGPIKASDALYATLSLPAPSAAIAASYWSTIASDEVKNSPVLASILPKEQPYDHAFVSVESSFSGKALIDSLLADPDGTGPIEPMPQGWWREGLEVVSVEVERQQGKSDGTWSDAGMVPPTLGRSLFITTWSDSVKSTSDMQTFVVQAKERSAEILRPAFYKTLGSRAWEPPSKMAAMSAAKIDVNELAQKQTKLETEKKKLEDKKAELAKLPAAPTRETPAPRDQNPPTRPGERPTQPTPPQPPKETKEPTNITAQRNRLNADIKSLEQEIAKLESDIARLSAVQASDTAAGSGASLLSADTIRFWVHDATAQPGEKYRYRLRVGVNNPLFGRGALLKAEQKSEADASIVRGPWSEWSSPVEVDRSEYFFVTSVTPRSELGEARVSVELFKFYLGYYRKQTAGMNIGDPLVGDIPLPKALASTLSTTGQPAAPVTPTPPGPGGREVPPTPPTSGPTPGTSTTEPAAPVIDFVVPDRIRVATSILLLDVAQVPGVSGNPAFAAILRDVNGSIDIKTADHRDQDSALYKRLDLSAKAGEAAAVAKP